MTTTATRTTTTATSNLVKTSHYMSPASREHVQQLAQTHARSASWIVRRCLEYGLAHAEDVDFQAGSDTAKTREDFQKAIADFFGDQPT